MRRADLTTVADSTDDETAPASAPTPGADDRPLGDAWAAVRELPGEQQKILEGIYLEGKTYQEMSDETGVPLGTLKRRLRESFEVLRARLVDPQDGG